MPTPTNANASNAVFWKMFCKKNWEKKAMKARLSGGPFLGIDSAYLFHLLVRYSDYCRKTRTLEGMKLFIEGESQYLEQVLPFLPEKADGSLLGYHERMSRYFGDYCLVCDELTQVISEKWKKLGKFMDCLYREVGMPNRYSEIGLYLGNYRTTPFGVHLDGCGVLTLPIIGTKRFRLWEPEVIQRFPKLAETHDYKKFNKYSRLLIVKPGELSYWPSRQWHIAESSGEFHAAWSIGVWVDMPLGELANQLLGAKFSKLKLNGLETTQMTYAKNAGPKASAPLPVEFQELLASLAKKEQNQAVKRLRHYWKSRLSNHGFKSSPRRRK